MVSSVSSKGNRKGPQGYIEGKPKGNRQRHQAERGLSVPNFPGVQKDAKNV